MTARGVAPRTPPSTRPMNAPRDPNEPRRSDPDERRLAEGLIAQDRAAVSEFLGRTHHPVYCMACRFTTDPELRQDWTHTVLLEVLEDLARGRFEYRGAGSFWAWFKRRAYFRLLDAYRRHRRDTSRESVSDAAGEARDLDAFAGGDDPAEEAERAELREALENCLSRLPNADQRRALALLLLDDFSYEDIAAAMSSPLNTVRAWIHRARLAVRRCLAERLGRTEDQP